MMSEDRNDFDHQVSCEALTVTNLTKYQNHARFDGHKFYSDMNVCKEGEFIKLDEVKDLVDSLKLLITMSKQNACTGNIERVKQLLETMSTILS